MILFFLLLGFTLWSCLEWRAYHQVTMVEIEVVHVAGDGTRRPVPTPEKFRQIPYATAKTSNVLHWLQGHIRTHMESSPPASPASPGSRGGHYEWTIRHSHNSLALDKEIVLTFKETGESLPDP